MPRYTAAPLAKRRPSATPISLTYEGSLDYVVGVQTVSATPELTAPSKAEVSPPPHKRTRNPPASAPDQCAPPAPSMDIAFLLNATNQPPRPADVCHAQWCAPPSPPARAPTSPSHTLKHLRLTDACFVLGERHWTWTMSVPVPRNAAAAESSQGAHVPKRARVSA